VTRRAAGQPAGGDTPPAGIARWPGQVLSPLQGFAVFCAWTAVLLVGAAVLLRRRDA
jgi:hypothetical protein